MQDMDDNGLDRVQTFDFNLCFHANQVPMTDVVCVYLPMLAAMIMQTMPIIVTNRPPLSG